MVEFSCGNAAGPIDGDCSTTLYGGGGRSLDCRAAFVPSYTARCIIRTIAARGLIKLLTKYMNTRTALLLLMTLPIHYLPGVELPVGPAENVVVVGALPTFGKLDGIDCVSLRIRNVNTSETVYVCYRHRRANDFKIGDLVYGYDVPVSATQPTGVIHRIILQSFDDASKDRRAFVEIPPELYRDVSQHWFGAQAKSPFGLARKGSMLTLCLEGGDGAGSYTANWIIDLHTKSVRRVVAYSEQDTGPSTPWLKLTKIENPNIVMPPDYDGQQPGAGQPATKPAEKAPVKVQPSPPTSEVSPR